MKRQIVVIRWVDAAMYGNGTRTREEAEECELMELVSVGVLIKENDTQITLGMDFCPRDDSYRCVNTYPKTGITSIRRIKL